MYIYLSARTSTNHIVDNQQQSAAGWAALKLFFNITAAIYFFFSDARALFLNFRSVSLVLAPESIRLPSDSDPEEELDDSLFGFLAAGFRLLEAFGSTFLTGRFGRALLASSELLPLPESLLEESEGGGGGVGCFRFRDFLLCFFIFLAVSLLLSRLFAEQRKTLSLRQFVNKEIYSEWRPHTTCNF